MTDDLERTAALIWPGSRLTVGRLRSPGLQFVLLPSSAEPRLVVPLSSSRAAAAVVLAHGRLSRGRSLARSRALAAGLRSGLAVRMLRDRLTVEPSIAVPGLDDHLRELIGRPVAIGFRLGPPRANRKPVIQVVDLDGELLGFAKLGINPLTDRLVANEASALTSLAAARLARLEVPPLRFAGMWQGHQWLLQGPLTRPRGRRVHDPDLLRQAMVEVSSIGGVESIELSQLIWWESTVRALDPLQGRPADALRSAAAEISSAGGRRLLRVGAWHGDWNPGNYSVSGQRALVWDWERFERGVPVGFDALHHGLHAAISRGVPAGRAARQVLSDSGHLLAPFGVASSDAPLVAALYLLTIGVRYSVDDQLGAGAELGNLESWLLPTLRVCVDDLAAVTTRAEG